MTLAEIKGQIKNIKSLDFSPDNIEKIIEQVHKLPLPVPVTILRKDFYICRARYVEGDFPGHRKQISFPYDSAFVKSFGRCNFKGQQVFYGSVFTDEIKDLRLTGISEIIDFDSLDRNQRHFIAIGRWLILENINMAELYLSDQKIKNQISRHANENHNNWLSALSSEEREKNIEIMNFFSDEFTEPRGRYELTSAISNRYFKMFFQSQEDKKSFSIEGLSYPSVKTEGLGMNVALLPDTVDKKLKLEVVLINEIVFVGPKEIYLHNYEISTDVLEDGRIINYKSCSQ